MDGIPCEEQDNLTDGMGTENIEELHSSFDNLQKPLGPIKEVKTTFAFTSTGSKEVYITGSFTNWREHILMDKTSANTFTKTLSLPIGIHSYKYIVDGEWKIDPSFTTMPDSDGNINNFINVSLDYEQAKIPEEWTNNGNQSKPKHTSYSLFHNQLMLPGVQSIRENKVEELAAWADGSTNIEAITPKHRLLLVTVGLPARGKTFAATKLARYLEWLGYKTKTFNFDDYRQKLLGKFYSHDWYHPNNIEGANLRQKVTLIVMEDIFKYYKSEDGLVAIFDGTNCTTTKRNLIINSIKQQKPELRIRPIFLEIICNDEDYISKNIVAKLASPDYVGMNKEQVFIDFMERIKHYISIYEPVTDECRYVRVFDGESRQIVMNRVAGFLPSKVMFYLSNLRFESSPIYFVRHGESEYNLKGLIGGDSGLTDHGQKFAKTLAAWVSKNIPNATKSLCVWSSTMKRAVQTSVGIPCAQYISWKSLDEIEVGICDGMSYEEIAEKYPHEFAARSRDKLRYRYPRGESYEDLIRRIEPAIIELERRICPTVVIGHQATLRCFYAYFSKQQINREEVPRIELPSEVVIKVTPHAYGAIEERFPVPIDES